MRLLGGGGKGLEVRPLHTISKAVLPAAQPLHLAAGI